MKITISQTIIQFEWPEEEAFVPAPVVTPAPRKYDRISLHEPIDEAAYLRSASVWEWEGGQA